jgi:eukaryotic-like serine/threonine-protein kinase
LGGRVTLTVTAGPIGGRRFDFSGHDTFLFGRSPDCHAQLSPDDTSASRHHFLLEANPPAARLRDLGSLNGTHVNGVRYGGRGRHETPEEAARRQLPQVDLRDGDEVRVGATVFRVSIEAPAACCDCGRPIPDAERAACAWMAGTFLCPDCRKRTAPTGSSGFPPPAACARCGRRRTVVDAEGLCDECGSADRSVQVLIESLVDVRPPLADVASVVGDYEVGPLLGRGGMGAVYLARRRSDGAEVALKVMLARVVVDEVARDVFRREIEVTRSIRHPNVVELLDYGSEGEGFYFAMTYCPGGSVESLIQRRGRPLDLATACRIALEALEGLAYAHERGFVHRDIKPDNLLLGDRDVTRVTDFGLAKSFQQAGLSGMTATGAVAGTLWFMPREQLTNFRLMKPVSDVWSMGATLYYLLTRRFARDFPPGEDPLPIILRGGVVPIREREPGIPEAVASVIDRAIADDLSRRFADAGVFRDALREAL